MPYCQTFQNKISNFQSRAQETRELLDEFGQAESKQELQKLEEQVKQILQETKNLKQEIKEFKREYQEQVKQMLSDWWPGEEIWKEKFLNNIEFDENGEVKAKGGIELPYLETLDYFPKIIKVVNDELNLYSLTSFAKGLSLPQNVNRLFLSSLTTAEGLNLPQNLDRLLLNSIPSVEDLNLNNVIINDLLLFENLPAGQIPKLLAKYPHLSSSVIKC